MSRHQHYTPPEVVEDLFTPPSVAVDTSEAAAERIAPHVKTLLERVYKAIRDAGGLTAGELEERLDLKGSTVRPRLWELEGNAPAGQRKPAQRITKTAEKRNGMRVYRCFP